MRYQIVYVVILIVVLSAPLAYGQVAPKCQVTPTALDFGTVAVSSHEDATFTIENIGTGQLMGSVTETCDHYSIVSGGGSYKLGAGRSVIVTVRFEPTSSGTKTCMIETGTSCSAVSCTGVGDAPPECQVSPASLDFGTVTGGGYLDMTFTITNTGGGTLSGSVSEACDHYSILFGEAAYSLGGNQSVTVTVRFEPTSNGTHVCTVETGSAACGDVSLTGAGAAVLANEPAAWGRIKTLFGD